MATIRRELSQRVDSTGESEIILRLSVARGIQPRIHTGLYISPSFFHNGIIAAPRAGKVGADALCDIESQLGKMERRLLDIATTTPRDRLTRQYLTASIRNNICTTCDTPLYDLLETFLEHRSFSDWRVKRYRVLAHSLRRFEAYRSAIDRRPYSLGIATFSAADIAAFVTFLRDEHEICERHPELYATDKRRPAQRGNNTIINSLNALRAFFNWCHRQQLTDNRPFSRYNGITAEVYGTPYYISIDERNIIADTDLSSCPDLAVQRDIFIFHCLVGCRVSDLMRLTSANIIDGAVEYVAGKTRREHPDVIRVPLHARAAEILSRYPSSPGAPLLPFVQAQRYNEAIRRIFTLCGITRPVTVLNPVSGLEEQRPINEIATSHLARRTFVGNLYKKVRDPCLVSRLSGHKDGSKAFARYRDIDEDIKRDLIDLLT